MGKGEIETTGLAGDQRIFAFQPFADIDAYIAVGIPKQPVLDETYRRLFRNLILIGAFILGSCLIGGIAAEALIVRPTRQLTDAALAVGQGEFGQVPDLRSSIPEMHKLLLAFRGMASELRRREKELKASESKALEINRNLLLGEQMANAGYWRVDRASQHLTWSDGVYRVHGRNPDTFPLTLANAIASIHPEDRRSVAEAIEMAFALHRDFEHTIRILSPDGEIRHIISRGFCELGPDGSVTSVFGAIIDVTLLKETEARLMAASLMADNANRAKSDFLSSMTHELRTPLTSVIGFADLMLMKETSEDTQRYLTLQRDAGRHLMKLIDDILDHSKVEAGKLELEAIPFDLRALITSCRDIMMPQAQARNLTLTSAISVTVPETLVGDPGRLKQVLLNLLGNAIKFTSSGSVDLSVDLTGVASEVVALKFSVRDTGIGIPADRIGDIFQRFTQASSTTTRQFGGTGLGLSISRGLIEAMGGSMAVESIPAIGSTFWFDLRLLSVSNVQLDQPPRLKDPARRHARILVADDSPANQLLFSEILLALGHDVVTVGNGAEAVEAVREGRFDIVLMDMQMPVMDGIAATRMIRMLQDRNLPVIGLTANAMQSDVALCLKAGMNAHLAKPVDIMALSQMIERMIAV